MRCALRGLFADDCSCDPSRHGATRLLARSRLGVGGVRAYRAALNLGVGSTARAPAFSPTHGRICEVALVGRLAMPCQQARADLAPVAAHGADAASSWSAA